MNRIKRYKYLSLVCVLVTAGFCLMTASRADVQLVSTGPPHAPGTFDKSTVQALVDNAENDRNATLLKAFYFNQRMKVALPQDDGYAMVIAALADAKNGSDRWFCLESLKGYAAFRLESPKVDDGFDAYRAVFSNAGLASDNARGYELQKAVKEYVFSSVGQFTDLGLQTTLECQKTLAMAWSAYAVYLSRNSPVGTQPDWKLAVTDTNSASLFKPLIAKERNDGSLNTNFEFLVSSASITAADDVKLSLSLIDAAKESMPNIRRSQDRYYDLVVKDERLSGKLPAAIESQKERIAVTKHGCGLLLSLDAEAKDWADVKQIANEYSSPDADPEEIVAIADALSSEKGGDKSEAAWCGARATKMLADFLALSHSTDVEQLLHARLVLATIYEYQHDYISAEKTADVRLDHGTMLSGMSFSYLQDLKSLSEEMKLLQESSQKDQNQP